MKIIKLEKVHYLSFNGIILTMNNPFVEATEENLNKLKGYIDSGFLVVKDYEDNNDKQNQFKETDLKLEEALYQNLVEDNVKRFPTKEEFEKMSKKSLIEFAEKWKIDVKPTMNKKQLIELILS